MAAALGKTADLVGSFEERPKPAHAPHPGIAGHHLGRRLAGCLERFSDPEAAPGLAAIRHADLDLHPRVDGPDRLRVLRCMQSQTGARCCQQRRGWTQRWSNWQLSMSTSISESGWLAVYGCLANRAKCVSKVTAVMPPPSGHPSAAARRSPPADRASSRNGPCA